MPNEQYQNKNYNNQKHTQINQKKWLIFFILSLWKRFSLSNNHCENYNNTVEHNKYMVCAWPKLCEQKERQYQKQK